MRILIDTDIANFDLQQSLQAVSIQRREQALRFRHEAGRRQSVAVYRLLQRALAEEYGIMEAPNFSFGEHGKPFLADHPGIHFSLSHCRAAVACAVSCRPVGIDVEVIRPYKQQLAAYVLSEEELEAVLHDEHPGVAFTKLWTLKESFLKYTGQGVGKEMKHLCMKGVRQHTQVDLQKGFVWSVTCSLAEDLPLLADEQHL